MPIPIKWYPIRESSVSEISSLSQVSTMQIRSGECASAMVASAYDFSIAFVCTVLQGPLRCGIYLT